jgi:hypothetical protein
MYSTCEDTTVTTSNVQPAFALELYYERDSDGPFADEARGALLVLLSDIAPHVQLDVFVLKAVDLIWVGHPFDPSRPDIPNHRPTAEHHQSLLITNADLGANYEGLAGPGKGCLSKQRMQEKLDQGGDSADISIHEWLHTIEGLKIGGRTLPSPDNNGAYGFDRASGWGGDGKKTWHDWYRFILRP